VISGIARRTFLTALGGAAASPVLRSGAARAQQAAMPVVGVLSNGAPADKVDNMAAFLASLRETGFVDGQNVRIDYRYANNRIEALPALAAELVRKQVAVIFASSTDAGLVAKAATQTVPIVFAGGANPAKFGFTGSLNRPGGNLTGVSFLELETAAKRLQLLHEIAPKAVVIGLLVNPTVAQTEEDTKVGLDAARVLGLDLRVLKASDEGEIDAAFAKLAEWHAGGVLINGGNYFTTQSQRLADLAARYKMPGIFNERDFPHDGGLMSYGTSLADAYRIVGNYVGRILKGEKVGDLPVQETTKVELIINLKAARALGLEVPLSLLGRADEVIE
jgi:putative tryptophan/tyrosine transport system substrate-binding protein